MKDLYIRPDLDKGLISVTFTPPPGFTGIDYKILEGDKVISEKTLAACFQTNLVQFQQHLPEAKPWSVEQPFLYKLMLTIRLRQTIESYEQTFGMTKIHVQDRQIYFNNKPFYMRGYIRGLPAHDHPNLLGCSARNFYEKNIKMAKAYGFNFVRFHTRGPDEEFLKAADQLGILCQVEIKPHYGHYQRRPEMMNFDGDQQLVGEKEWESTILRLRNHPCVMIYCLGNEINSPGTNELVKIIRALTKTLDPSRLFLDACSKGQYDRDTTDLDVQHMSYFAPFGKHRDMFDDSIHLSIYGSVKNKKMIDQNHDIQPASVTRREIPLKFPLIAHEVCHYSALRDPYRLDTKFKEHGAQKPWWIDELIKMIRLKGHENQYPTMLAASARFQYIWIKQCLESIRKSPILTGFQMLQLADTDRYEYANGLLDCFDEPKDISSDKVLLFNSPTVIIADLPKRSIMEETKITIPIHISHYAPEGFESGLLRWRLTSKDGGDLCMSGLMDELDLSKRGNYRICRVEINLPQAKEPQCLIFSCELASADGKQRVANRWDLWLFPNRPYRIPSMSATIALENLRLYRRYPQIVSKGNIDNPEQLLITDKFGEELLAHLEGGKDALVMYRLAETREKKAPKEKYYLPSTWERFKPVIGDRGHNCGGFLRKHPIVDEFPHDGFIDWQFYNLIEDSDKIDLDDFPVRLDPIIEGVDKAVRDRFDVSRFGLSEFQYAYTMRKFAYLFELKVGRGRLVVTGLSFKDLEKDEPATCWMFENIINYMISENFSPQTSIAVEQFRNYLLDKGQEKRVKDRMMTQFWQFDDAPLESREYWKESEQWLREGK